MKLNEKRSLENLSSEEFLTREENYQEYENKIQFNFESLENYEKNGFTMFHHQIIIYHQKEVLLDDLHMM